MQNDYDNYSYEDRKNGSGTTLLKKLLIFVLVVIAIIALILLLKGCVNKQDKNDTNIILDTELLKAGKHFFDNNTHKLPSVSGECSTVSLETLLALGLINKNNFTQCNMQTTYVQVCMLEDKSLHWTPWLTCTTTNSDTVYGDEIEGTIIDLIKDETLITKFLYLPQMLDQTSAVLGKVEEVWKDEITYDAYETIATTKYYRYKDLDVKSKEYYSTSGTSKDASKINEYYTKSPASGYDKKDNSATVYKWYTLKKIYYTNDKGEKIASTVAPEGYDQHEEGKIVKYYRTRKVTGEYAPTLYYKCAIDEQHLNDSVDQAIPCGTGNNKSYDYQVKQFYTCAKDTILKEVDKNSMCDQYGAWTNWTLQSCGIESDVCDIEERTYYYWYRLDSKKVYYPSGSNLASSEKVYFKNAPVKNAQRDTSTKTTGYKWYKETSGQSNWSSWSTKEPDSKSSRKIESRIKVKLKQIISEGEAKWKDLTNDYVTFEEMKTVFKNNNYEINTLQDINNNGQLNYKIKMYIRNKKVGTNNG